MQNTFTISVLYDVIAVWFAEPLEYSAPLCFRCLVREVRQLLLVVGPRDAMSILKERLDLHAQPSPVRRAGAAAALSRQTRH